MCGIAGFIDPKLNKDESLKLISSMLKTIAHRGPDYSGQWMEPSITLGHNRLSILDLSPASHQPFLFEDLVLTYNGEIYNYLELKEELKEKGIVFNTTSDTEVITAAYKVWGKDCVKHFVGMWAFAIWDKSKKTLFCSRDRFGIKPFYYIHKGNKFYFGSEYKPLKKAPLFENELNNDQIYRGLQLGWVTYKDETYYQTIKSLPPAHNLIYKDGETKSYQYWDLNPCNQEDPGDLETVSDKFRELFLESLNIHMRSDVPVGGCLSGGLDSSAIASAIGKKYTKTDFNTYTIYYTGENAVDERPFAEEVTKKYNSLKPRFYSPSENEIKENLEKMIGFFDVPPAGSSPLSQFFVMQLASKDGMKVLLDGQGADEYLAGYNHSFYRYGADLMKEGRFGKLYRELGYLKQYQGYSGKKLTDIFLKSFLTLLSNEDSLYNFEYRNYFPFLPGENKKVINLKSFSEGSKLNHFLYHLTFNSSLPTLLHNEDRNSMAYSIESRVPFLDHRILEFVFSLANKYKYDKGWTKTILRKGLNEFVPEKITKRTDKKGFVTPGEVKWLRGPLKNYVEEINLSNLPMLREEKARKIIRDYKRGDNTNAKMVWRLAMLNKWVNLKD